MRKKSFFRTIKWQSGSKTFEYSPSNKIFGSIILFIGATILVHLGIFTHLTTDYLFAALIVTL